MNEKTIRILEFDAIRARVADCALSEEAKAGLLSEMPLVEEAAIRERKLVVAEIAARMRSGDEEKQESLPDIGFLIPKLAVEGAALSAYTRTRTGANHLCAHILCRGRYLFSYQFANDFSSCFVGGHCSGHEVVCGKGIKGNHAEGFFGKAAIFCGVYLGRVFGIVVIPILCFFICHFFHVLLLTV